MLCKHTIMILSLKFALKRPSRDFRFRIKNNGFFLRWVDNVHQIGLIFKHFLHYAIVERKILHLFTVKYFKVNPSSICLFFFSIKLPKLNFFVRRNQCEVFSDVLLNERINYGFGVFNFYQFSSVKTRTDNSKELVFELKLISVSEV
jgi:hypothetical protein